MSGRNKATAQALTKNEMVEYIGPIFEDLHTRLSRDLKTTRLELETAIESTKQELEAAIKSTKQELMTVMTSNRRELEVLLDANKREIVDRLDTFFAVSAKAETVGNHELRISTLETEMTAVKTTLRPSKG